MALTVQCARCHDHKYDPIPIDDYYSLYGVFASSREPGPAELPLIAMPSEAAKNETFEKELAKRKGAVDEFLKKQHAELTPKLRTAESMDSAALARKHGGRPPSFVRLIGSAGWNHPDQSPQGSSARPQWSCRQRTAEGQTPEPARRHYQ